MSKPNPARAFAVINSDGNIQAIAFSPSGNLVTGLEVYGNKGVEVLVTPIPKRRKKGLLK